jgi:hypothetical protein
MQKDQDKLHITFQMPPTKAGEGHTFKYIEVYGYKQINGVRTNDVPEGTFSKRFGEWHSGDMLTLDLSVPKRFSDGTAGRVLRIGVGDDGGYSPSPNLLTGTQLRDTNQK